MQSEDALENENMRTVHRVRVLKSGMLFKRVDRNVDLFSFEMSANDVNNSEVSRRVPCFDVPQMVYQEVKVNGLGSVEIVFISEG